MENGVYDLGLRLKALRQKKRFSQKVVAARIGVTRATISAYENNLTTPSVEQLVKLALLYGASLDYMLNLDRRDVLYLDDLTESQRLTVRSVVDLLKKEFQKEK